MISFPPHPDTVITKATPELVYILPCTWKCSCDWSKTYTGRVVTVRGSNKLYHVEGDRLDGKETPEFMTNPNKK